MTLSSKLQQYFSRLGDKQAFALALLGILAGIASALLIVLFRLAIELPQTLLLPAALEDYEALSLELQILLPTLGFFAIALYIHFFGGSHPRVGLAHVMDRTRLHQGHFPLRNIISQFFTGAVAVISGQSAGREGAAVHLGAGVSSILGNRLKLNNQNMRLIVACGSAAAISASFNTPLAGVVFAMEVVLMEYAVASFIPVILSSVIAAVITRSLFGDDLTFMVPAFEFQSLWELPYLLLLSILIGLAASLSILVVKRFALVSRAWNIWLRFSLAAAVTAMGIYFAPQIMGLGYDTVNASMLGEITWQVLLIIALAKILVTSAVIGLGVPSGFIGPSLVMGACLGAAFALITDQLLPANHSDISFYATLGMAAMMGAILQAPLAALIAALEFTGNSDILLPAMLVIVFSNLISNGLFKQKSVFQTLLDTQGNLHDGSLKEGQELKQWLKNTAVNQIADSRFSAQNRYIPRSTAHNLTVQGIKWILIRDDNQPTALISSSTLAFHLRFSAQDQEEDLSEQIDLLAIPGEKKDLAEISSEASLATALDLFSEKQVNALFLVNDQNPNGNVFISSILLKDHLDQYFRS